MSPQHGFIVQEDIGGRRHRCNATQTKSLGLEGVVPGTLLRRPHISPVGLCEPFDSEVEDFLYICPFSSAWEEN